MEQEPLQLFLLMKQLNGPPQICRKDFRAVNCNDSRDDSR